MEIDVPASVCTRCGSAAKAIRQEFGSQLGFDARFVANAGATGDNADRQSVRVSGPKGREASSDTTSGSPTTQEIHCRAPRGKEGRLETATLLVHKLRELGEPWGEPYEADISDIDCQAITKRDLLDIQVVRAARSDLWKALHQVGQANDAVNPDELGHPSRRRT